MHILVNGLLPSADLIHNPARSSVVMRSTRACGALPSICMQCLLSFSVLDLMWALPAATMNMLTVMSISAACCITRYILACTQ